MSTSATNMYNPRLLSSTSSENDVEESLFLKPGQVGPTNGVGLAGKQLAKNQAAFGIGDDSKRFSALSDSSNVLKRKASQGTGPSVKPMEAKSEFSPVSDEQSDQDVFPEPETLLQQTKDTNSFSIVDEEINQLRGPRFPTMERNANPVFLHDDWEAEDGNNGTAFSRDVVFETTTNSSVLQQNNSVFTLEGDAGADHMTEEGSMADDAAYPEIERFPRGYGCCPFDYTDSYQPFSPQPVSVRCDVRHFPDLPDNLFPETALYPEASGFDLEFVELPESPKLSSEYEARMQMLCEEDC